jgi:drug/metabolite transporter (DMT)-like permease
MNTTETPNSFVESSARSGERRVAIALFVAALAYVGAAFVVSPDFAGVMRGFAFPLRLFLIAVAPTIAGVAFLWSDRAIEDERRKRLTRILVLLLCGYAGLVAVSGVPW